MLIHRMHLDDNYVVLDVNSGAVHIIDATIYDILGLYDGTNKEAVLQEFSPKYGAEEVAEILAELAELQEQGLLFSPEFPIPDTFKFEPVLKSLCLNIAHDCNLRCRYCFAGTGDFGGKRALMSKEVAEKAVDFAIAGSKSRHNLELDLFGGEPLVNFPVVEHVINYVRKREAETGKNIKLTLTTNGTLLTDEIIEFLNKNRVMLVLSLDGSKETHDYMRPMTGNRGSYDKAVAGFKRAIASRQGKNYYLRGTYTHHNVHFADDTVSMLDVGREISMEPVVGTDEDYVLTEEDFPIIEEEYEKLARIYLAKRRAGEAFDFFHFNVALDNGPCVAKRLAGCGAGHEYYAITPEGDIYPCHQFVGREKYKMGTLDTGITKKDMIQEFRQMHVMQKPACRECWARFFCSGGCHANADLINGDLSKPYEYGCKLQRKRLEMAIIVQALLSEEAQEGKADLRPVIDNFKFQTK